MHAVGHLDVRTSTPAVGNSAPFHLKLFACDEELLMHHISLCQRGQWLLPAFLRICVLMMPACHSPSVPAQEVGVAPCTTAVEVLHASGPVVVRVRIFVQR